MSTEIKTHGLTVGIERVENNFFFKLTAIGTLTHADYEVITPILDSAIEAVQEPHVYALVDIRDMEGWESRAAWDDYKLGLKHGNEFVKVALVGNKAWQEMAAKVSSWFITGEVKYFVSFIDAVAWLKSD